MIVSDVNEVAKFVNRTLRSPIGRADVVRNDIFENCAKVFDFYQFFCVGISVICPLLVSDDLPVVHDRRSCALSSTT